MKGNQTSSDLALSALVLLARLHHIAVNPADIQHQFDTQGKELDIINWQRAAKFIGLKARPVYKEISRLPLLSLSVLV
ncbi:cysteine peptidase family C39 domain-containing protein [Mesocricetibacter intestinalis]|uniref:cysteine peptidase family C39 domain-containing protein n=1 Tax=Mesocricetibacter intestinalis TaxID=1521930 RepID=UPI001060B954|nr:cysteine peptidase family C39 domain-containing protein [Mesocricetibacter intestinalis]